MLKNPLSKSEGNTEICCSEMAKNPLANSQL